VGNKRTIDKVFRLGNSSRAVDGRRVCQEKAVGKKISGYSTVETRRSGRQTGLKRQRNGAEGKSALAATITAERQSISSFIHPDRYRNRKVLGMIHDKRHRF